MKYKAKHPRTFGSQMGVHHSMFLYLILIQACKLVASSDSAGEWKPATATYSVETDGSLITGNPFSLPCTSSLFSVISSTLLTCWQEGLVVMGTFIGPPMASTVPA